MSKNVGHTFNITKQDNGLWKIEIQDGENTYINFTNILGNSLQGKLEFFNTLTAKELIVAEQEEVS